MTAKKKNTSQQSNSTTKYVMGLLFVGISVMLFIAILSFFVGGGADRSIFDLSFVELIKNTDLEVRNQMGKLGAWVADALVTQGIGLMSLSIPFIIGAIGFRFLVGRRYSLRKLIINTLLIVIWGSIFLGLTSHRLSDQNYPLIGGMHGYYVSKWLISSIGLFGTILLLLLTGFIYISLKFTSVQDSFRNFVAKITNHRIVIPPIYKSDGEIIPDNNTQTNDQDEQVDDEPDDEDTDNAFTIHRPTGDDEQPNDPPYSINDVQPDNDDNDDEPNNAPTNNAQQQEDNPSGNLVITTATEEETTDENRGSLDTPYDPTLELSHYKYPDIDFLVDYKSPVDQITEDELKENRDKIVETLAEFKVEISQIFATVGPTVTLYELVPAKGVKISKIQNLQDDIAMRLKASGVRIIAPMPGNGTVGIEVANSKPQVVSMRSVIMSKKFQESTYELPIALGKTISNETFVFDLTKTPHLLVAGATGQGKSVGLNAIIASILYRKHPSQVKFVLVDPKMVEFSIYRKLEKHFLAKMISEDDAILTDVERVKATLVSLATEMDDRYKLLQAVDVRSIKEYNKKFIARQLNPENGHRYLPYIVVIIDEFADLIMTAGKEVEMPIARIAQKARAVGIHMILATQRPSTNIITGVIKANFPARMAFKVSSMVDSRTILDTTGAQHLIGRGDLLMQMDSKTTRVQCALIETDEVSAIANFIGEQQGYAQAYPLPEATPDGAVVEELEAGALDPVFADVARMVVESQNGSTSNIQRRFSLGYNRAGKIMDQLVRAGIVEPGSGSKPGAVLIQNPVDLEAVLQRFGVA